MHFHFVIFYCFIFFSINICSSFFFYYYYLTVSSFSSFYLFFFSNLNTFIIVYVSFSFYICLFIVFYVLSNKYKFSLFPNQEFAFSVERYLSDSDHFVLAQDKKFSIKNTTMRGLQKKTNKNTN